MEKRRLTVEKKWNHFFAQNQKSMKISKTQKYSARRLIGSRIIESTAYCDQKSLAHLYLNNRQNTSLN
jgi:hypothetical protein